MVSALQPGMTVEESPRCKPPKCIAHYGTSNRKVEETEEEINPVDVRGYTWGDKRVSICNLAVILRLEVARYCKL
jgi:NRPS condensation-like uncharacterized protein